MGYILPKNAASIKPRAVQVQPRPVSRILNSIRGLAMSVQPIWSDDVLADYYMNYYMNRPSHLVYVTTRRT